MTIHEWQTPEPLPVCDLHMNANEDYDFPFEQELLECGIKCGALCELRIVTGPGVAPMVLTRQHVIPPFVDMVKFRSLLYRINRWWIKRLEIKELRYRIAEVELLLSRSGDHDQASEHLQNLKQKLKMLTAESNSANSVEEMKQFAVGDDDVLKEMGADATLD